MIIRIFAAREPAKPLNDAQMCGSFLFLWVYGNKNSVYKNIFAPYQNVTLMIFPRLSSLALCNFSQSINGFKISLLYWS